MWGKLSQVETQRGQQGVLTFAGFQHGLNTVLPASLIQKTECSKMVNWNILRGGGFVSRYPITKYIETAISGSVKFFEKLPIDGVNYELIVGSDYKLYYVDAEGAPAQIGGVVLEGEAQLVAYNGAVVIMDGSYLKYLDGVTEIKMLHDDGTGTTGYQFDNRAGGDDSGIALGDGTNTRVAYKFTSQAWTAGYTIPPTTFTAVLQRIEDGYTGLDQDDINIVIRKVSDDSEVASKRFISFPIEDNVAAVATTYSVTLTDDDITAELIPNTAYYASLEYDNGDSTNYVSVRCKDVEFGPNLLTNGNFDSVTTGWTSANSAVLSCEAGGKDGKCLKVLEGGGTNPRAFQAVTVEEGEYYRLNGYVKDDGSSDAYSFYIKDETNDANIVEPSPAIAETDWTTTFSQTIQAPADCESIGTYLGGTSTSGDGKYFLYDEIYFRKVEEPGTAYVYTGTWAISASQEPLMSLRPGRPPKGSFGKIAHRRLFVAGDPDNPGYVWFNNLTHKDWSTSNGGGYVSAVDANKNTYEVGALISLYGDLYVLGTQEQPYMCQLTGSTPTSYALPLLFQRVWSLGKTALSIGNDAVFASGDGVDNLGGVQEYGDLRSFSISDPVADKIRDYWSSSAIAGYHPKTGQYFLTMPDYHRTIIFHMKTPSQSPDGMGTRYPASESEYYRYDFANDDYEWIARGSGVYSYHLADEDDPSFDACPDALTLDGKRITKAASYAAMVDHQWWYGDNDTLGYDTVYFKDASGNPDTTGVIIRSVLIPTCYSSYDTELFMGGSDGYVYKIDEGGYKDMDLYQIEPILETNYTEFPFSSANFVDVQVIATAKAGAVFTVYFYKDSARAESVATKDYTLGVYDDLTVGEALMTVGEALFTITSDIQPMFKFLNFNGRSLKMSVRDIRLLGHPLYFNGLMVKYRMLRT